MADEPTTSTTSSQSGARPGSNGNGHNGGDDASPKSQAPDSGGPPEAAAGSDSSNGKSGLQPMGGRLTSGKRLLIGVLVAAALLIGGIWGFRFLAYSRTHVSTDNAFVTGNLVNVSPIVGGTLSQLTVAEGDTVRQGQLIARLEDSGPRASLQQAQATYRAALSQVPQARSSLRFQQQATDAAIRRAQAALTAQQARTR
ncbi:MAG: biotin/lipoyl-binding protein, partial [Cytophagales bacterium]|nr:biotin/lipoyl-binding protein [Armatimonadota bacterium]